MGDQKRINGLDSLVFASLVKAQRPLSIKQIAKHTGITWPTANSHVQKLVKLNVLTVKKTIRKNRVQINSNFTNQLKLNNFLSKE